MTQVARSFLLLLVWAFAAAAPAQRNVEGLYIAEVREVASALELRPQGRFRWAFSMGALDLLAEGRWRVAEDGTVILDTEPPVRPPEVTFLGSGREAGVEGLLVRVSDPSGNLPPYLDIEAEYETGPPGYAYLDGEYRFDPEPDRRIAAVRLLVRWTGFRSERFAVPANTNVLRFRFAPNDLGRADFRGARAVPDGEALVLSVIGEPLRYRRLSAEEQAEYDGVIADIAAEAGSAGSEAGEDGGMPIPSIAVGPIAVAIGEPLDPEVVRALPDIFGARATTGAVEALRVRIGEADFDFGRIAGERYLYLSINSGPDGVVDSLAFTYQDRLLTLAEAVARARSLDQRLRAAGFRPIPEAGPSANLEALAAAPPGSTEPGPVPLLALEGAETLATVTAQNLADLSGREGEANPLAGEGDRVWTLDVTLARPVGLRMTTAVPDGLPWEQCINSGSIYPRSTAIEGCTALIESGTLEPVQLAAAHFNRGNLLTDDGQAERAIPDYGEAMRLSPEWGMPYWGRAGAYADLGDLERAVADSRRAVALEPDNPDTQNYLCWHLAIANRSLEEARAACEASLRLRPDDPETLDSRAMVALRQGRFQEAWDDYDAAVRLDGRAASFVYGRGLAALRLGRTAEGQADLARAAELDPAIAEAYARYGVRP